MVPWSVGPTLYPVADLSLLMPLNRALAELARGDVERRVRAGGRAACSALRAQFVAFWSPTSTSS